MSKQPDKSSLLCIIPTERIALLQGGHDAIGIEHQPLNLQEIEHFIKKHKDKVSAFAVSAMFDARNTTHDNTVRDLIIELSGKPVACGHELVSSLVVRQPDNLGF